MAIQTTRRTARYSDLKTNLDAHPDKKDLVLNTNEDAVKRSIRNLMLTEPYERLYKPRLGAGLAAYLFENIDIYTEIEIRDAIISTVENFEPRAQLQQVDVSARADENGYDAKIVFTTINNPNPTTLNVILERVR